LILWESKYTSGFLSGSSEKCKNR